MESMSGTATSTAGAADDASASIAEQLNKLVVQCLMLRGLKGISMQQPCARNHELKSPLRGSNAKRVSHQRTLRGSCASSG